MRRIQGTLFQDTHLFITALAKSAYTWAWLVPNPVLARYVRSGLFKELASKQPGPRPGILLVLRRLAQYYANNLRALRHFILARQAFRSEPQASDRNVGEAVVLDCEFFTHQILDTGTLDPVNFFPGVLDELRAAGVPFIVAPTFYGDAPAGDYGRIAAVLRRTPQPVLTVFDSSTLSEVARLVCFTLCYPLALLVYLAKQRLGNSRQWQAFRNECLETLPGTVVPAYLRFLQGRGLARTFPKARTMLSWCENRAGDKMFYRGLRTSRCPVKIIGAQLFVFPDNYLGAYITEAETLHGLAPDRLLVNGQYYLPDPSLVKASVGPSLRYSKLFQYSLEQSKGEGILITLGWEEEGVSTALKILAQVSWPEGMRVSVRFHPSHRAGKWLHLTPPNISIAKGDLYENFRQTRLIIGSETGSMVEAIACGIPVINLDALGARSLRDMPQLGRGTVWFLAKTARDIEAHIPEALSIPEQTLRQQAEEHRRFFFCQPKEGRLLEQLGLQI